MYVKGKGILGKGRREIERGGGVSLDMKTSVLFSICSFAFVV